MWRNPGEYFLSKSDIVMLARSPVNEHDNGSNLQGIVTWSVFGKQIKSTGEKAWISEKKKKKSNHKIRRTSLQGKLLVQRQTLWRKRSSLLVIKGKILSAWSGLFSNYLRSGSHPKAATRDCFQGDIFAFVKGKLSEKQPRSVYDFCLFH